MVDAAEEVHRHELSQEREQRRVRPVKVQVQHGKEIVIGTICVRVNGLAGLVTRNSPYAKERSHHVDPKRSGVVSRGLHVCKHDR